MNGIDARPRSATEIIDAAFNVLRQRYGIYVTAAAIMYVPILLLTMAGYGASGFVRGPEVTPFSLTAVFLQLAWITITNAVLSIMTSQVFLGGEPDTNAAISLALRRAWPIVAAGAITIAAGVYELSPLKQFFRRRCRENVRSGFEFGLDCVGSSIGLMLMLVALGVMSAAWMSVIAVLIVAQKLLPARAAMDVPVALAIVGLGILIVIAPSSVPGLMPPLLPM